MSIKHHINKDGSLIFPGVRPGNLVTGEPLTWDQLRELVIKSTRFATGRKVESRSLQQLVDSVTEFLKKRSAGIDERAEEIKKLKQDLHNAWLIVESLQDKIGDQNQEINELRNEFIKTARDLEAQRKDS